ncbi:serine hydrolase [Plantactinospora sp. S1510]|uniref:Serine hydrolase n=1 Tax=Plantactinospora alkalitolerans TaxID=2789879 RepID=A0ABS0H581_9ACTN|nr:serine hydrolase [Plantactinospora alkalitolerans]MBF9133626.1 serine hydrolase [Plantactinospora alkalitolerans]
MQQIRLLSRHLVALTGAIVLTAGTAPAVAADDATGAGVARSDGATGPARSAWLSIGSGIFSVDIAAGTVRYRACSGDTGRLDDPEMAVLDEVVTGRVRVAGTTYRYELPLNNQADGVVTIDRGHGAAVVGKAPVVVSPQPAPLAGREPLGPLTVPLRQIVDASAARGNPAGVSVLDLSGRYGFQEVAVNGGFRPKAASVIKLWILAELLRRVDCGRTSLDAGVLVEPADVVGGSGELQKETFPQVVSVGRLAQYMIIYSDNTAANVLIDFLGGFAPVNALIDSLNLRHTVLARKMLDTEAAARGEENYLTADDVVSLLGAVWDGNLLSAGSRETMIRFMREQTINTKIPAALPPGVPVAHKTGELTDASHDVGYYLVPGSEVAVTFVTSGPEAGGAETVRQLARAVYDYLERGRRVPAYPVRATRPARPVSGHRFAEVVG